MVQGFGGEYLRPLRWKARPPEADLNPWWKTDDHGRVGKGERIESCDSKSKALKGMERGESVGDKSVSTPSPSAEALKAAFSFLGGDAPSEQIMRLALAFEEFAREATPEIIEPFDRKIDQLRADLARAQEERDALKESRADYQDEVADLQRRHFDMEAKVTALRGDDWLREAWEAAVIKYNSLCLSTPHLNESHARMEGLRILQEKRKEALK